MKKIINFILLIFKYILFLGAFAISFYIEMTMNQKTNSNIGELIVTFIPYLLLLILFFINIILRQRNINHNIFYNLVCCLVFIVTIIVGFRAIYDKNMILNKVMGYNINFIYFTDYVVFMKILIYGLCIANILFMINNKNKKEINNSKTEVI